MKTNILKYVAIFIGAAALTSCNYWLDMTPTNKISEKTVWENEEYIELYVNSMYPYIHTYSSFNTEGSTTSGVGLTEGCTETLKYNSIIPGTNVGFANMAAFAEGGQSVITANSYFGTWAATYPRIRRVNEFIYSMNLYGQGYSAEKLLDWEAQARFFRGMLYFELVKRNKDVILYDENMLEMTPNTALNTEAEGWQMIYEDLTFAGENLPATDDVGRVTKGAAYALLSRAMLYAQRWQDAKEAAEQVLLLNYSLVDGSTYTAYNNAFTSASSGNTEAILEYNYLTSGPNHTWDKLFMPGGDQATQGGSAVPTQEMVESYELADGSGLPDWSMWYTEDGTVAPPPYSSLEPRFHASILYNNADWKGRQIESYVDGLDGWLDFNDGTAVANRTCTSYFLRKFVNESHTDYSLSSTQPWIAIRLAEVYLNYAEACYMTDDESTANDYVKKIRARVGLPYTSKSGDELMAAIREERKIELYCEGHRYWDMRRWGLSHTAYSGADSRVHGFKVEKVSDGIFRYTYVDCDKQDRLFEEKLYRLPIPETELSNNTAVTQFSEWL